MRAKIDALRSLRKYVSQALSPQPTLAAVTYGTYVWTLNGMVNGGIAINRDTWHWLLARSRTTPVEVGTPQVPSQFYLSTTLLTDPLVSAAASGITLPTVPDVTTWGLPTQPHWEVRLWYDRGEIPADRPHARVEYVGAGAAGGPSMWTDMTQPFSVECYPVTPDTVTDALIDAGAIENLLTHAFQGEGVEFGRPLRVPLWNWDGVPSDQSSDERYESDYMRVLDFSTRQLPDPQEPRRIAVIADIRLAWDRTVDPYALRDRKGRHVRGSRLVELVNVEMHGS